MNFVDATPVKITGGGRKAAPNPYLEVVAAIAHKTQKVNGADVALAKSATFTLPKGDDGKHEAEKTVKNRIRTQLTDAGKAATPPCTVHMSFIPKVVNGKTSATEYTLTIWTGPVITRTVKPKDDDKK